MSTPQWNSRLDRRLEADRDKLFTQFRALLPDDPDSAEDCAQEASLDIYRFFCRTGEYPGNALIYRSIRSAVLADHLHKVKYRFHVGHQALNEAVHGVGLIDHEGAVDVGDELAQALEAAVNEKQTALISGSIAAAMQRLEVSDWLSSAFLQVLAFRIAVVESLERDADRLAARPPASSLRRLSQVRPCQARWVHFLGKAELNRGGLQTSAICVAEPGATFTTEQLAAALGEAQEFEARHLLVLAQKFEAGVRPHPDLLLATIDPTDFEQRAAQVFDSCLSARSRLRKFLRQRLGLDSA